MNSKQITKIFFEIEDELDLLTQTIDEVYFWERVRYAIHTRLLEEKTGSSKNVDKTGFAEYISGLSLFLRNIAVRNPYFGGSPDLLFFGTGRRKQVAGEFEDVYIDPLLEDIPQEYLCLERPYKLKHLQPAATDNLRYTDLIEYTAVIGEIAGVTTVSLSSDERSLLTEITDKFQSRFGTSLPIVDLVLSDLSKHRTKLNLYRRLIKRTAPKLVLVVNSYNGRETFVEACQIEEIPVAELQHGVITKHHMGYSFPEENKHIFPDYFFAFGDFWPATVSLPLPEDNIYSVGYANLERTYQQYANYETTDQVVFISQAYIGERLSKVATALAEHAGFNSEIVYKLHPKEYDTWRNRYPWLDDADIRVVSDDPPLYRVFAESTAQIGVGSTALYEGLKFSLDTYIVELPGYEYMDHLLEHRYAVAVSSAREIANAYTDYSKTTRHVDAESFFSTGAIDQFQRVVEEILTEHN